MRKTVIGYLCSIKHTRRVLHSQWLVLAREGRSGGTGHQGHRGLGGALGLPSELGGLLQKDPVCLARVGPSTPQPLRGPGPQLQLEGVELQALPQVMQLHHWLLHSPHRWLLRAQVPPGAPSPPGCPTQGTSSHQHCQDTHDGCPHQDVSVVEKEADPCKRRAMASSCFAPVAPTVLTKSPTS